MVTILIFFATSATCNFCDLNSDAEKESKAGEEQIEEKTAMIESQKEQTEKATEQSEGDDVTFSDIKINDVSLNTDVGVIEVTLSQIPSWGDWKMYVDGKEMPTEGGKGNPVVRPNGDLKNNPTGLLIGTEPWPTNLAQVDFPCCGTLQFYIPGKGLTNDYEFNLVSSGCKTASKKQCEATSSNAAQGNLSLDISPVDIYPDNQPNGLIWTRIKNNGPDILQGGRVSITLSYTKKDLSGNIIEEFISDSLLFTLSLKPGETQDINLNIAIDNSGSSYFFEVTVNSFDFADSNNSNNYYATVLEPMMTIIEPKLEDKQILSNEFPLVIGECGSISWNYSVRSNISVGDNPYNNPERGFLSFNISQFSGVKLVDCSLSMWYTTQGDIISFGPLCAYMIDYGNRPIELNDFDLPGTFIANSSLSEGSGTVIIKSDEFTKLLQSALDAGKERFQIRFQFNYPESDSDFNFDVVYFYYSNIKFKASFMR